MLPSGPAVIPAGWASGLNTANSVIRFTHLPVGSQVCEPVQVSGSSFLVTWVQVPEAPVQDSQVAHDSTPQQRASTQWWDWQAVSAEQAAPLGSGPTSGGASLGAVASGGVSGVWACGAEVS